MLGLRSRKGTAKADEDEGRDHDAGHHRVEVAQQLLQAEEVPRGLRRVRRQVRVRELAQRRVHERREEQHERREHDEQRDELLDEQVRPDVDAVALFALDALDALGGTSASSRCLSWAPFFGLGDVARGPVPVAGRRGLTVGTTPPGCRGSGRGGAWARAERGRRAAAGAAAAGAGAAVRLGVRRSVGAHGGRPRAALGHAAVGALRELGRERLVEDLLVERRVFARHVPRLFRRLQRSRDAAVLADPPEVDRQEDHQHERQREHVQHVPTQQRVRPDHHAAQQQEVRLLRDERE